MSGNNEINRTNSSIPTVGIIGSGWVGNSYANEFISRGIQVVCYSLDPEYLHNRDHISNCDIVFIAVPTPTDNNGADYTILREVIKLVGQGKIAVIKSTVLPGTTALIQQENPGIIVVHSPEFLSMATAAEDAAHPARTIIGLPIVNSRYESAAQAVLNILPESPFTTVCNAADAELIKYAHNCGGYLRIVFHNLLYDITQKMGGNWDDVKAAMAAADPWNKLNYLDPVHKSGRGAGGPCFIKDFSAFVEFYKTIEDEQGLNMLSAVQLKNIKLLEQSGKDLDILQSVHPSVIADINLL